MGQREGLVGGPSCREGVPEAPVPDSQAELYFIEMLRWLEKVGQ